MDFDGNGRLDLVSGSDDCCNWHGQFFVFRRGPDSRFRQRKAISTSPTSDVTPFPWFSPRTKVYVTDWNGNGQPDLIVSRGTGIYLALGPLAVGDEIQLTRQIEGGELLKGMQTKPNVADWDGDGLPDLLVALWQGPEGRGVYLLRGVSHPEGIRLGPPELLIAAPEGSNINGLDVVDWDGDGLLDLIVGLHWREPVEGGRPRSRSQVWVYRRIPPQ